MEKINCKECGKEINIKAEICPHCGCRVKSNTAKTIAICLGVIIALTLLFFGIKYFISVIETNNKEKKADEIQEKVNGLPGEYSISKEEYLTLIDGLKNEGIDDIIDIDNVDEYTFEIKKEDVPKYSRGSRGTDYDMRIDDLKYNIDDENNFYVRLSTTRHLKITESNYHLIEFVLKDNELCQVDGRDTMATKDYIKNYNVCFKKIEK